MCLWRWVLPGLVAVCILGSVGWPGASPAGTLCHPDEQIVFNCTVQSGKTVSLCRSPELTQHQGVLQYRFGRPGAVELQFPPPSEATPARFRYAHYFRAHVDRTTVGFTHNGYTYTLFDDYEGDTTPVVHQQGVEVSRAGQEAATSTFLCRGAVVRKLSSLEALVPCDQDDPLHIGHCP
jgi:hypothetical protein